jgi:amidase
MGFASEHVLTRTVRDSAAALDASQGPEITSPYWAPPPERPFLTEVGAPVGRLRIAFTDRPHLPGHVHADCRAAMLDAAKLCEELGHDVEEASPVMNGEAFAHAFFTVVCGSVAAGIEEAERDMKRKPRIDELEIPTWLAGLLGGELSAANVISSLSVLQSCARDMHRFFDRYDVLLTPTLGAPPLRIGDLEPKGAERLAHRTIANLRLGSVLRLRRVVKAVVDRIFEFVPFPPVANVTGQPSMSVPLYWNQAGLPIGSMFTGRFGQDAVLFRLAGQLEQARPWAKRRPPIFAE